MSAVNAMICGLASSVRFDEMEDRIDALRADAKLNGHAIPSRLIAPRRESRIPSLIFNVTAQRNAGRITV